jgi:hypothetical protein
LFPEGGHFLVREGKLTVDFLSLVKELLLTSFQLGLLTLQFLLVSCFATVGVGQQAHALRIRGEQFPLTFLQLALFCCQGLIGEDELLSCEVAFFAYGLNPRGVAFIRASHLRIEVYGQV